MCRYLPIGPVFAALLLPMLVAPSASAQVQVQAQTSRISFEDLLHQGKLAEAERVLGDAVKVNPDEDNARFALGVVQFLRAVEGRMQAFYRHGCRTDSGRILQ